MRYLAGVVLALSFATAQATTYTAASSSESAVAAAIALTSNGDTVQIPCSPSSSTWTTTLTVTNSITITGMGATPNTGASTFGSGKNCLTIVADNSSGPIFNFTPTYASSNNLSALQNINIDPMSSTTALDHPISLFGTCTSSGCPQVRIDNIVFGNAVQWTESGNSSNAVQLIHQNDVFGVADHNTIPSGSAVELVSGQMGAYLGVGQYGDNSWAQPDSMGEASNWFNENNVIYAYIVVTDCTEGGDVVSSSGGCRLVNRFNHIFAGTMFQLTGVHGTDTTGRPRSARHTETYGNTVVCSINCNDLASTFRGGTGVVWGNTGTISGSGFYGEIFDVGIYRPVFMNSPFGACGGLTSIDPWDTIDNTVYYSGTVTSGSGALTSGSGTLTITTSFSALPNLAPIGLALAGAPYSVYDVTQHFVTQITSNTTNTVTVYGPISEEPWSFNNGDSIEIIRATVCIDQSGRGQGAYISGTSPTPVSPLNQALDPVYEWDDSAPVSQQNIVVDSGQIIQNRDFYTDDWRAGGLSRPMTQTSPTLPFNGSTTCNAGSGNYTCGIGFGTLANRPPTCTTGVAYFATDQGTWNQSSSGGQGELFKCDALGTWHMNYEPYTYPHPLTTASTSSTPNPPTNVTGAAQPQ